jgi:hypothetical protein
MSTRIEKIYVDMDGVIADFEKRYKEKFKISPSETRDNKSFGNFFDKFIADKEFATLDMMQDGQLLLAYLNTLNIPKEILSSTASEKRHNDIMPQKTAWLKHHKIDYKVNLVPGKQHKFKFSTPDSIIIDDTESVIDDWNMAGGIGILHTDAVSTISMLKMYV